MKVPTNKERHTILSYFEKTCWSDGSPVPPINKYQAAWAASDLIQSYGFDTLKEMIDYYALHSQSASWKNFAYGADKVYNNMIEEAEDEKIRRKQKRAAQIWIGE